MVKDIITIAFNSLEVEKTTDNNNNNTLFSINTPPIIIRNKAILKVSNFCHIGTAAGHTDNMYLFRIRGVIADTSRFFTGSGGGLPLILTTTFNNNRSLYDENVITLTKQTINAIDILVDTYLPTGFFNNKVNIISGGTGYLTGQRLQLTGGGGSIINLEITDATLGNINSVSILNTPTDQYTTPPTLSNYITGTGASITASTTGTAPNKTILSISIIGGAPGGGAGYKVGQTLSFTGGGGSGAIASISSVDANGRITNFTITNAGGGYSSDPTVSINPTTQTQTANIIPSMRFGSILSNSIPNSLNFSITFIIEQDVNE